MTLSKKIFEARIELATSSVLDWRDNQLHHPNSVAGVMVSIAAFQAVDPGSIPGPRRFFRCAVLAQFGRAFDF